MSHLHIQSSELSTADVHAKLLDISASQYNPLCQQNVTDPIKTSELKKQQDDTIGKEDIDYDTLLSSAGILGPYQFLLLLSTLPFHFFGICVYYSQLFMTEVPPEHWCWIPELENLTQVERRNLAVPIDSHDKFGYSHCEAYDADWTAVLSTGIVQNGTKTVACQHGWEFDKTEFPYPTISTDLEWVCSKKSYQATAQAIFFCGSVIGGIIIGWLADKFGRVPATIVSSLLGCVGGTASTFANTFLGFAICRFLMGMSFNTCQMIPFVIVLEYIAPKYRSILANSSLAICCAILGGAYPFLALACGHWKTLSLVSSLPMGLAILAPLFLPESPRWLLSQNRVDEVIGKIKNIARINRKQISINKINQFKETYQKRDGLSILEVFKKPLLRKNLILVSLIHMMCLIIFDSSYRNLDQLEFDFFITFSVTSSSELISGLLTAFTMDVLGRQYLIIIMATISSVACFLLLFLKSVVPSVLCAVIARFAINIAMNTSLQWSAEFLPTAVRGSGVSFVISCGNFVLIFSPYITYLRVYLLWLPYGIMGCLAALSTALTFVLPETAKKGLPQTFHDAEILAKNRRLWRMPWQKKTEGEKNEKECHGQVNLGFECITSQ